VSDKRYVFIVDFENEQECGIGVVSTFAEEQRAESPTGPEIALVLRRLAKVYDDWPGTTVPVRYDAPRLPEERS